MNIKLRILLILTIPVFVACKNEVTTSYNIGQKSFQYEDSSRNRPLKVELWYPTLDRPITHPEEQDEVLFKTIASIPNASFEGSKFPLIVVSHGTGGNRFSLTWIIESLVKEGYIVVSLGHYGNTTFHKLPREFVKWWERAIDIQFVLSEVLEDNELNQYIDSSKIGGLGFSLGGYTNIALAGGLVDRTHNTRGTKAKRELPPEFPKTEEAIDFVNDSLILASYHKYKNNVKDDRMKAFFVMAPAIGFGFYSKKQTEKITSSVFIVAGKGDTNSPIEFNALNYHNLIENSELHLFNEDVNHYVFLNEATDFGKKVAPEICIDHASVDRKQIHDITSKLAVDFFNKSLN